MRISLRPSPLVVVALTLVGAGAVMSMRPAGPEPEVEGFRATATSAGPAPAGSPPRALAAEDFCRDAGYLCAPLSYQSEVVLRRWVGHEGTIVVHVPLPEGEDPTTARALQQAAVQGIRAWNNQPFPVLADIRGDRNPLFAVEWKPSLGGSQIGQVRTRWSERTGISVFSIELGTRPPYGGSADPRQIRLTAAHEMGHALGLPHSDEPRDVMYPTNTATSMTARDYRSIEVLYAMPNGTRITAPGGEPSN